MQEYEVRRLIDKSRLGVLEYISELIEQVYDNDYAGMGELLNIVNTEINHLSLKLESKKES